MFADKYEIEGQNYSKFFLMIKAQLRATVWTVKERSNKQKVSKLAAKVEVNYF